MKVGLFLDIDGVFTEEPVNLQYAKKLGIRRKHKALERKFERKEITSDDFGNKLAAAFRKKKFTEERATELTKQISYKLTKEKIHEFLNIFKDVYIVSSSPNYFINQFREEFSIPSERTLCSIYEFDQKGIKACSDPVDYTRKAQFVKDVKDQYDICIGIGDFPEQDAAFLSHCHIQILMREYVREYGPGYLSVDRMEPINILLSNLKKCISFSESAIVDRDKFVAADKASKDLLEKWNYEKNVFIMTAYRKDDKRYEEMENNIRSALSKKGFNPWFAKDKTLDTNLWTNVQAFMLACKYGIAVFTASEGQEDDITQHEPNYNPNVSIELGFMLSRGREVLILKDKRVKRLMTDMGGRLYGDLDLEDPAGLGLIIEKWVDERLVKG